MKEHAKGLLLESAISHEMEKYYAKLRFYGYPVISWPGGWESNQPLSLEKTLKSITAEEFYKSPGLRVLCGMGWEFVWGEKPPAYVTSERAKLIKKAEAGIPLGYLENLWYHLISGDTDLF